MLNKSHSHTVSHYKYRSRAAVEWLLTNVSVLCVPTGPSSIIITLGDSGTTHLPPTAPTFTPCTLQPVQGMYAPWREADFKLLTLIAFICQPLGYACGRAGAMGGFGGQASSPIRGVKFADMGFASSALKQADFTR